MQARSLQTKATDIPSGSSTLWPSYQRAANAQHVVEVQHSAVRGLNASLCRVVERNLRGWIGWDPCSCTPRGPPWLGRGENFGLFETPKRHFLIQIFCILCPQATCEWQRKASKKAWACHRICTSNHVYEAKLWLMMRSCCMSSMVHSALEPLRPSCWNCKPCSWTILATVT